MVCFLKQKKNLYGWAAIEGMRKVGFVTFSILSRRYFLATSQQYFSLSINQRHPRTISQPVIFFSKQISIGHQLTATRHVTKLSIHL